MQANIDQLIVDHAHIARRIALKVARRCPDHVEREDLVAAGMMGLTEAALRYDVARAEPFIGFAERRIRGAVLDELRRGDLLSRRARKLARTVKTAIRTIEANGDIATEQAIADALGVSIAYYQRELASLANAELESIDDEFATKQAGTAIAPDEAAEKSRLLQSVRDGLAKLDTRDAQVLSLHFLEELSYTEVGAVLGITPSRVCQLVARAMERLRAHIGGVAVAA